MTGRLDDVESENASAGGGGEKGFLPLRYKLLELILYCGLIIWLLFLLYTSRNWTIEDRLLPQLVGIIAIIFVIGIVLKEILASGRVSQHPDTNQKESMKISDSSVRNSHEKLRKLDHEHTLGAREKFGSYILLWTLGLPIGIYYFGFLISVPLFLTAFDYSIYRDMKRVIIIIVGYGLVHLFVTVVLGAHLWGGVVELGGQG